jgi:YegS/Rv2252/BmrU family lipid kinase
LSKAKLILNPMAGRGRAEGLLPIALAGLRRAGFDPDVARTKHHRHAILLAEQAVAEGYDTIFAMGGDGTTNEVLNGLMSSYAGEAVGILGVLPVGSGNDFCKAIDWPTELPAACERLLISEPQLIDIGQVNDRYFGNGVGVGFDAIANIEAAKIRFLRGTPLYLLAVLKTLLLHYCSPPTQIILDGQRTCQRLLMASVTNGPCYGGGFWVTPEAKPDDGLFEVLIASHINRLRILALLPHFLRGTHVDKRPIHMAQARHVVLESDTTLYAHVDGEIYSNNRLEFHMLPAALRVLT